MNNPSNKFVSLIIPVYNEEKFLDKLFKSIENQDYQKDLLEVIIVDGNSTDKSFEILKNYQNKFSNLIILNNPQKFVSFSLNLAIKESKGDYIVRWDAHTEYENNYISKCVEYLNKTDAANVGGAIRLVGDNPIQKAIKLATTSIFGIGNSSFHYENFEGYVDTVYLGAFRKEIFEKIGFFDEELVRNQDDELNYRIIKSKEKIFLTSEIKSYYYPRNSLKSLWKQYFQYGYWKVKVIKKHKIPASIRHLVPVTFILSIILGILLSLFKGMGLFILIPVLSSYTLALLFFTTKICIKENYKNFGLLAFVFTILHFSYGIGFLNGLIHFFKFNLTVK